MPPEKATKQADRSFGFLIVFSWALLVRALYLYQQQANPLGASPIGDSLIYVWEARKVLEGDWGQQVFTFAGGAFYHYFLAIVFALFGESYLAVQIVQHLMGAVSCGVICLIGNRLYGRWIGLVLGLWAAVFSPFLFHEGLLLTSAPTILFLVLSLFFLLSAIETTQAAAALLSGVLLGLAVICRPNVLLLAPVYLVWILLKDPRSALKRAAPYALVLGAVLVVLPVTVRNYVVARDLVLISSGGGFNFYLGNNPDATGVFHLPQGFPVRNDKSMYASAHSVAERELGTRLEPSEVSRYWFGRGLQFLKDSPAEALGLYWKKFYLFWNDEEITNLYHFGFFQRYSFLLRTPLLTFGVLAILGLIGASWILPSGTATEKLFPVLVVTCMVSVVIFFISSRLRVPVAPLLFITAGYTLKRVAGDARLGQRIAAAAAALMLVVFVNLDVGPKVRWVMDSMSFTYLQVGQNLLQSGQHELALEFLSEGVEQDPENVYLLLTAGEAAEKSGNLALAREMYLGIVTLKTLPPPEPFVNQPAPYQLAIHGAFERLGLIALEQGNLTQAERFLKGAIARHPGEPRARRQLARLYEGQGRLGEALDEYAAYLKLRPGDQNVRRKAEKIGKYLQEGGR